MAARIWANLFDEKDPNGSWQRIEPLLVGLIRQRQPISSAVASNFIAALRSALEVPGRYVPTVAPAPTADDIVPWLRAAAQQRPSRLLNADRTGIAADVLESINGSITRQVLDGGRHRVAQRRPRSQVPRLRTSRQRLLLLVLRHAHGPHLPIRRVRRRRPRLAPQVPLRRCAGVLPGPGAAAEHAALRRPVGHLHEGLRGADARLAFRQAIEGRITAHP